MVVAVLVNRIAPSSRGLDRTTEPEKSYRNLDTLGNVHDHPKRKPFRAIALLTSLASDLDVISDWLFCCDTRGKDQEYRNRIENDSDEDKPPFLIPPLMITLLMFVCISGSCLWLILATDGRVLTPLLKRLGVEKISMGHMLFLCVVLEDLPQVVLTFLIEDCYEGDGALSNFAVMNLTMSLYDTLIKLAEAFDERNDVVETGVWCKESMVAHSDTVTSVLALPLPPSTKDSHRHRLTFLEKAMKPISPTEIPRLRFLTTSKDRTIRLWDTAVSMPLQRRKHCVRTFCGHLDAVTCVALLEKAEGYEIVHPDHPDPDLRDEEDDHNMFFISGCRNGNAKLWNLHGDCIRSFYLPSSPTSETNGITSVNVVKRGATFVCGHDDGSARLWEAWSGICIAAYKGHSKTVSSVCSLEDETLFLTGSHDESIKLWDVSDAMKTLATYIPEDIETIDRPSSPPGMSHLWGENALHEEIVCKKNFLGHSAAVLTLACVERGVAFLSGSADGTARLWSIQKKFCLRIFAEHHGPVRCVASMDQGTFLTGSDDTTVKVWSALSKTSLRTYEGHEDQVTDLSVSDDDTTFLSASNDHNVRVWVLTTIPKDDDSDDDDFLDYINDFACMGRLRSIESDHYDSRVDTFSEEKILQ